MQTTFCNRQALMIKTIVRTKHMQTVRKNRSIYSQASFIILTTFLISLTSGIGNGVSAEETSLEKVETAKNKSVDAVKKTYRKVDDKVCESINGKLKCVPKKIKNKIKNTSDKIDTDTTDAANKID